MVVRGTCITLYNGEDGLGIAKTDNGEILLSRPWGAFHSIGDDSWGGFTSFLYSPNGKWLFCSKGGHPQIRDPESLELIIDLEEEEVVSSFGSVGDAVFSDDSSYLFIKKALSIFAISTGDWETEWEGGGSTTNVHHNVSTRGNKFVITWEETDHRILLGVYVEIRNIGGDWDVVHEMDFEKERIMQVHCSHNDDYLYISAEDNFYVYDTSDWNVVTSFDDNAAPSDDNAAPSADWKIVTDSHDSNLVAYYNKDDHALIRNTDDWSIETEVAGGNPENSFRFSPNDLYFAYSAGNGGFRVCRTRNWKEDGRGGTTDDYGGDVDFSPTNDHLCSGQGNDLVLFSAPILGLSPPS